jgi:hypothetical protein
MFAHEDIASCINTYGKWQSVPHEQYAATAILIAIHCKGKQTRIARPTTC